MRKHVVFLALSSSLLATAVAGAASADGPPRPRSLADVLETPAAWVLRVPLTLTLAPPRSSPSAPQALPAGALVASFGALRTSDLGRYPDPRLLPIRRFHLESRLEQDFVFEGIPLTARMVAYLPERAWQALDVQSAPVWQSDVVLRLPRDLYAGGAVEQRTTAPRSIFVVAGPRF
jgi:hypothetical protein